MLRKVGYLVLLVLAARFAQAVTPCCAITAIDARSDVVTAKETAGSRAFKFKLNDAKQLSALKVGQAVEADFTSGKVAVRPAYATPCCSVTAMDARSGAVTVKETATGRTAQLKVSNPTLLGSLKVGQGVNANLTAGSITVPAAETVPPIAGMIVK